MVNKHEGDGSDRTSTDGDRAAERSGRLDPERNATADQVKEAQATNPDNFTSMTEMKAIAAPLTTTAEIKAGQRFDSFGIDMADGTITTARGTAEKTKPQAGSAEETGTVIDYRPAVTGDKSFALGMDWEEEADTRAPSEKLVAFLQAAAARATDPVGWQAYLDGQVQKFIGIGEGLNNAKEHTKSAAVAGWNALTDGTVANFLAKPNAINDPLFHAVGEALDAMAQDPNAVNHSLERLGTTIMQVSEHYSSLPPREQGHIIGETAFFMVNPEGSTEAGKAGLKIADAVGTHVDQAVIDGIRASVKAAEDMAAASPELAQQARRILYDYSRKLGLSPQEMELAGIPKGYFEGIEPPPGAGKGDQIYEMSGRERGDDFLNHSQERPIDGEAAAVRRPSARFMSEVQEALDSLPDLERRFVGQHKIKIMPVRRIQDLDPLHPPNTPGIFDPGERTVFIAEEVWSLGRWRANPDVQFALRHEIGHAFNARSHPFGEWLSESAEFRSVFKKEVADISAQQLEEWSLVYENIQRLRDEIFADLFAHATGLTSNNARSQAIRQAFPKTLEYVRQIKNARGPQ